MGGSIRGIQTPEAEREAIAARRTNQSTLSTRVVAQPSSDRPY